MSFVIFNLTKLLDSQPFWNKSKTKKEEGIKSMKWVNKLKKKGKGNSKDESKKKTREAQMKAFLKVSLRKNM